MSNEQPSTDAFDDFNTEVVSFLTNISSYLPRITNVDYDSTNNITKIYGHTNFEELKVNGTNVSLQGHNHDSSYSAINHNHDSSYAPIDHNHDSSYAPIDHNHSLEDVVFTFEAKPDSIAELERNYRIDDNIIKFIVVRKDEE